MDFYKLLASYYYPPQFITVVIYNAMNQSYKTSAIR